MSYRIKHAIDVLKLWSTHVNAGDVDAVVNIFAEDAILLPTFSPNILSDADDIRAYFAMLAARPGAKVEIDEDSIVATDTVEHTVSIAGRYTFFFEEDGVLTAYPSRFTFVIVLNSERPISHQHSSQLPVVL